MHCLKERQDHVMIDQQLSSSYLAAVYKKAPLPTSEEPTFLVLLFSSPFKRTKQHKINMEVPTQIYSKALPSVQDMADTQFPEWFGPMAFASEDSSYFDDAMDGIFGDRTVQWGRDWTNSNWSGPDNFWSPAPFEEMKGFPPVAMSLFQQPTEKTALELLQGRQGSSLTAGFEGHTSPDESGLGPSVSWEDPESPVESDSGEPESREELRSPKSPSRLDSSDEPDLTQDPIPEALDSTEDLPKGLQSPEEQAEETLPRLLQDKNNSVGRPVAYETEVRLAYISVALCYTR